MFDKPSRNITYTSPLPPKPTPRSPGGLRNRQVIASSKASAKIARTAHARVVMKTLQGKHGLVYDRTTHWRDHRHLPQPEVSFRRIRSARRRTYMRVSSGGVLSTAEHPKVGITTEDVRYLSRTFERVRPPSLKESWTKRHTASVTDGTRKKTKITKDSIRRLLSAYALNAENTAHLGSTSTLARAGCELLTRKRYIRQADEHVACNGSSCAAKGRKY